MNVFNMLDSPKGRIARYIPWPGVSAYVTSRYRIETTERMAFDSEATLYYKKMCVSQNISVPHLGPCSEL